MAERTFTSAEVVTGLYRGVLKREPDPAGLETHVQALPHIGVQSAVEAFLTSEEYRQQLTPPGPDLTRSEAVNINLRLSDDDRAALWAHVGRVWTALGDTDPYWSVMTNPKYKNAKASDRDIIEDFYASGAHDVRYLDAFLQRNGMSLSTQATVAEFGCGVGRTTSWLARRYARVLAFDVSAPHLQAAEARMRAESLGNVEFVHVTGPAGLSRLTDFDVFFSFIVLQHNPPPIMAQILDHACQGLNPGGLALFQAPTYAQDYSFDIHAYLHGQYKKNDMEMHFIPQHEVFRILRDNGVDVVEVRQDHCIGNFDRWISNTFFAKKAAAEAG